MLVAGVAVLALAMVSRFPYAKLAQLLKLPPWLWVLPAIGAHDQRAVTFVAGRGRATWSAARCCGCVTARRPALAA